MGEWTKRAGALLLFGSLAMPACQHNVKNLRDTMRSERWKSVVDQLGVQRTEIQRIKQKMGLLELEIETLKQKETENFKVSAIQGLEVHSDPKPLTQVPLIQPEVLSVVDPVEKLRDSKHGNVQFYLKAYSYYQAKKHDQADISIRRF